ncbi:MAG: uncharacterized protein JWL73_3217 [Actinomycetia bacterium]|nr:uncharacterized protein [Actinomycetes bacterium]
MTRTTTETRRIDRSEASTLSATENLRMLDLLRALDAGDWSKPTDCDGWDVRALCGHVLGGMEGFCSTRQLMHIMRAAKREAGDGSFVDAMTAIQVRERAELTPAELIDRLAAAGPRSSRFRARVPAPLRAVAMKQELADGTTESWKMGYLLDTILTRDTWMHRVDVARATGRTLVLSSEHDGRIVADAVGEWARRHGQPFTLELTGTAGGTFGQGTGGGPLTFDAVEFCRILSGRASGPGLLAQKVPF